MTPFTVTLLPESLVDNKISSKENFIYGNPVIITPGTSFEYESSTYDIKITNITNTYRPIIGMGLSGTNFLTRVSVYGAKIGVEGTLPVVIGAEKSLKLLGPKDTVNTLPEIMSERVWNYPLRHKMTYGTEYYPFPIFLTKVERVGVYAYRGIIENGAVIAGDESSSAYFPVAREDRYMLWGFYELPDYELVEKTGPIGHMLFINCVYRMSQF